jgi:beta-glucosidase
MHYLRELRSKVKKQLIIVVTGGSPVDLSEISEMADALLFVFYPGQAGGDALADILFGDVSPSGKLPITFPKSEKDLPLYADYAMQGRTYKYMEHEPQYPFGFGLSYARFVLGEPMPNQSLLTANDTLIINIPVTNESDFSADEVLQCYVKAPDAPFATPAFDLKSVKRISLAAGQTEIYNLQIPVSSLMSVNNAGEKVLLKGCYKLMIGTSLPSQRSKELGALPWRELVIHLK